MSVGLKDQSCFQIMGLGTAELHLSCLWVLFRSTVTLGTQRASSHPLLPAPSGAATPGREVEEDRRCLYSINTHLFKQETIAQVGIHASSPATRCSSQLFHPNASAHSRGLPFDFIQQFRPQWAEIEACLPSEPAPPIPTGPMEAPQRHGGFRCQERWPAKTAHEV